MNKLLYIPGSVPSSKNSRMMTKNNGFIASKATQKYRKVTPWFFAQHKQAFLKMLEGKEKPYLIGMHFVRGTRHEWDFNNPCQTLQDEMVKNRYLDDDNINQMVPVPLKINGRFWTLNKEQAGVYFTVLESVCDNDFTLPELTHNGTIEKSTGDDAGHSV